MSSDVQQLLLSQAVVEPDWLHLHEIQVHQASEGHDCAAALFVRYICTPGEVDRACCWAMKRTWAALCSNDGCLRLWSSLVGCICTSFRSIKLQKAIWWCCTFGMT